MACRSSLTVACSRAAHLSGEIDGKARLEAFCDGVIAFILTIMVLELKAPHGAACSDLIPLLPVLGSYVLSLIYVGFYWNKLQYASYPIIKD